MAGWLGYAPLAHAGLASFSVKVEDELREADVQLIEKDGVSYVSLSALVSQIGGGFTLTADKVKVDMVSKSAWIVPNDKVVNASVGEFSLVRPVIAQGDDALMAVTDVSRFFEWAFRLSLKQDSATAAKTAAPPVAEPPVPVQPPPPATPTPPVSASAAASSGSQRAVGRPIQVIVIDPGHGGNDAGCVGPTAQFRESVFALGVAQKLKKVLEQISPPVKVVLTRDQDRKLSQEERVRAAEASKGDLLVTLHVGASQAQAARGIQVFCCAQDRGNAYPGSAYAERSRAMGEAVAASLAETLGTENRGVYVAPCHVLTRSAMVGLLLEIGEITTPADEALLPTDPFQQHAAEGIAAGIKKYLAAAMPAASRPGGGSTP